MLAVLACGTTPGLQAPDLQANFNMDYHWKLASSDPQPRATDATLPGISALQQEPHG